MVIGTKGAYREPTSRMGVHSLLCESCGLSRDCATDEAEAYELWYATDFRGHRLWAHNREHLSLLISLFSGELRKEDVRFASSIDDRFFNARVIVESLPKWMVQARNRAGVLKCLRELDDT